ncbi:hypothetical protein U9M48_001716 [Paspalum notatum var. saurae]|uniref:Uncharacterized protein n=1 Tax=Paspalum notatum var. saurae TaxID=547442 RepID=A0AAQ3SD36_PASNO
MSILFWELNVGVRHPTTHLNQGEGGWKATESVLSGGLDFDSRPPHHRHADDFSAPAPADGKTRDPPGGGRAKPPAPPSGAESSWTTSPRQSPKPLPRGPKVERPPAQEAHRYEVTRGCSGYRWRI